MREYIYISDAKLEALAHLSPLRTRDRLRELNVSLGPVGGGVALSHADVPMRHHVIEAIEAGIRDDRDVAEPTAAYLAAGDWIGADRIRSCYGVLADNGPDRREPAAVFVADLGETGVLLVGSASHLLRPGAPVEQLFTVAASSPAGIGELLFTVAEENDDTVPTDWERAAGRAFDLFNQDFRRLAPPQPMSFLARVTHVAAREVGLPPSLARVADVSAREAGMPRRIVVATPLYVAAS